jgi:hypothetical protein
MMAGGDDCDATPNALQHPAGGQCTNQAGKPDDAVWYDLDAQ